MGCPSVFTALTGHADDTKRLLAGGGGGSGCPDDDDDDGMALLFPFEGSRPLATVAAGLFISERLPMSQHQVDYLCFCKETRRDAFIS